ncbi:MAG: hypothetical protein LBJ74_01710 [Heliobacteriaceae bacterium]|nr:hypothetical protein [Heliobacteriaceae bacterium]
MKKTILILTLICFLTPAAFADVKGYGPNRDIADRNTFEINEQILKEIEAAKNNPQHKQQQQNYQQNVQNKYTGSKEQHVYPTADEYAQQKVSEPLQNKTGSSKKDKKSKNKENKGGIRFKGQGSSPAQTQYHHGRPNYGFRQNY